MQLQNLGSILEKWTMIVLQCLAFVENPGLVLGANYLLEYTRNKRFSGFVFGFSLFVSKPGIMFQEK